MGSRRRLVRKVDGLADRLELHEVVLATGVYAVSAKDAARSSVARSSIESDVSVDGALPRLCALDCNGRARTLVVLPLSTERHRDAAGDANSPGCDCVSGAALPVLLRSS